MCGILGTIPASDHRLFKKALNSLIHRGPDGEGIWSNNRSISLGHRRLSILDLSDHAAQPLEDYHGRYCISFNGEIYNYLEIKEELLKLNYHFRTSSDTEVALAAFVEWGEKCVERFNGMWALAIWDKKKQRLFLTRDRFGKKPLFYTKTSKLFAFASEMKALLPFLSEVKPSSDFAWCQSNIFHYESTDKCLIAGIKRFPAGSYAYVNLKGDMNCQRFWCTLEHLPTPPKTYEEQVERFSELLLDSCKLRTRSDVPIGSALSGGLDSSAIVALVNKIQNDNTSKTDYGTPFPHQSFVACFPGTPWDEAGYAKEVVKHLGTNGQFIEINPTSAVKHLNDFLYKFEELYITLPLPMIQTYSSIKEAGISVTLDGHGADELFSGYTSSLLEALPDAGLNPSKIADIYNTYLSTFPENTTQLRAKNSILYHYCNIFALRVKRHLGLLPSSRDRKHPNFQKLDNFNQHLYFLTHESILPTLLRNYDRYSMAASVEIRMPFLDHRLVSYAFSLPWSSKIRGGFTKSIIRDSVRPLLPPSIVNRKLKIGFNSPILDWMKGPLREYFLDTVSQQAFRECDLIDSAKVKEQVLQVMKNSRSDFRSAELAWQNIMPYLWQQSLIPQR